MTGVGRQISCDDNSGGRENRKEGNVRVSAVPSMSENYRTNDECSQFVPTANFSLILFQGKRAAFVLSDGSVDLDSTVPLVFVL